jgi:low affinity Fe/Cu permease
MNKLFSVVAQWTAVAMGHPVAFAAACTVCVVWAVSGPYFGYSDTWQLVINTGTTVLTFLLVFVIQYTQNRDMAIVQIKLNELIVASDGARDAMLALTEASDEELRRIAAEHLERGKNV